MKVEIKKREELLPTDPLFEKQGVGLYRRWFREAVDHARKWQDEAREDYDFFEGRQWSHDEIRKLEASGRPALTINRIKPLLQILSGYQRLNRYDIEFLGRTPDDVDIAQVRKGITKYILDSCEYTTHESNVFLDAAICGLGWFFVGYEYDEDGDDGEAYVRREDPFGVYVDPESHKSDFSDARYICRARWVDKEELKAVYPEHADEIDAQYSVYDTDEYEVAPHVDELLWYKRDLQKIRLVECWHKTREKKSLYVLATGDIISQDEITPEMFLQGLIVGVKNINTTAVKVSVFFDTVLLEEIPSPYTHGEFPLVPLTFYYFGIGGDEIPAGFVRDLKNPQREINKRRLQQLHILNTVGNGGGWIEEGAMSEKQFAEFERKGNIPGHFQRVQVGTFSTGAPKIIERQVGQFPAGLAQAEAQATNDLTAISGINESLMGVDVPKTTSGRAIELRQKQAVTHIAMIFDNLRAAKKKIAQLLWGRRRHAGVIPQFYTEDKVYRVEGINGQQFIRVNQQVIEQDATGAAIVKTLNDLSQGEFDIVIADVEASTTQRQAQMLNLIDAVGKLGIPGDLVFDVILDLSDIPSKEEIKNRWQQRQESQAKAAQEQMQHQIQLEEIKNQDSRLQITFKDAPLPIQMAMAAKAGLIDPSIAQYAVDQMIQQMYPQLTAQQAAQEIPQEIPPEQLDQMFALAQMQQPPPQQQGSNLTQAATESLMRGMTPAI